MHRVLREKTLESKDLGFIGKENESTKMWKALMAPNIQSLRQG